MRLTCPNCGAQYEVPDEVVPTEGRDVQCSNCGNTWFQTHPEHASQEDDAVAVTHQAPDPEDPEDIEPAQGTLPSEPESQPRQNEDHMQTARGMDASVSDILREEADREAHIRATETEAGLESQPDLGLDQPDDEGTRRARQARERMARIKGETPAPVVDDPNGSRRGLLPDIEEINSTLRSTESKETAQNVPADPADVEPRRSRGGFTRGFAFVLLVAILLGFAYKMAPEIARSFPQADPMLSAFVALVDQARLWLDTEVGPYVKPYLN